MIVLRFGAWLGGLVMALTFLPMAGQAQPQNLAFDHFTIANGLSNNTVFTGLQDHQGYLWFGTLDGLNRCDGYGCTVFVHNPRDTTSLSHNWVWTIFEDRNQVLWVGTYGGGLNRFNRDTETFIRYQHNPSKPTSISNDVVVAIAQAPDGTLWLGSEGGGVNHFDPQTETFKHYNTGLFNDTVYALWIDEDGFVWNGIRMGGMGRFDPQTETFTRYGEDEENPNSINTLKNTHLDVIYQDYDGVLWIGTWAGGLHYMDRETGTIYRVMDGHFGDAMIRAIHKDQQGFLWVGTFANGVFRINLETNTLTHYQYEADNPHSLSNNNVTDFFEDHTGTLWIMTRGGVDRVPVPYNRPTRYTRLARQTNTLRDQEVKALWPDGEAGLWIGTEAGLNHLNLNTGAFTAYQHIIDRNSPTLNNASVRSLWTDPIGTLWMGTDGGGLARLNQATRQFTTFFPDYTNPAAISNSGAFALANPQNRPDELWVGTWVGLNRLDRTNETFTAYFPATHGLSDATVLALYEAPSQPDMLWIGTNVGGLNRMDLNTESITVFRHDPTDTTSLSNNQVLSFYEDVAERLWIGTASGLNQMTDRTAGQFRTYTTDEGLPNNTIHCILPDAENRLWIGTNRGVARFDPQTETFETFDVGDGLQDGAFSRNACVALADGRFAFGGEYGLTFFHPDSLRGNTAPPRIAITDFQLFGNPARINAEGHVVESGGDVVTGDRPIMLNHDQNGFSFRFAGLHFTNPGRNQYAYQLEGYRDEWVSLGTQREVSFTGLPAGDYVFHVRAASSDGVWTETPASVSVRILPPWWRTRWAYALYALFSVGAILGFTQWRSLRLRLRNQALSQLVEARTAEVETQKAQLAEQANHLRALDRAKSRFFANLSHEFRTPLTLIRGPIEDALRGDYGPLNTLLRDHLQITRRNTDRLRQLIDQLLDLTKLEADHMLLQARQVDMVAFLRRIMGNFTSLADRKMIAMDFKSPVETLDLYVDPEKFEQVVANLLANAFKYTDDGGNILVHIMPEAHHALIHVTDSGQGISPEALPHLFDRFYQVAEEKQYGASGTGIGLALVKEMMERHGGTVSVKSQVRKGTTFTLRLPMGRDHLHEDDLWDEPEPIPASTATAIPGIIAEETPAATAGEDAPLVLLIEDNVDLRGYLRDHLKTMYRIAEAEDGAAGFRMACEDTPDLIISDVMMPQINGLELLQRLKQHDTLRAVPVILLTARTEDHDRVAGFDAQADAYIAKPFRLAELKTRMAALLKTRAELQAVYQQHVVHITPDNPDLPPEDLRFLTQVMAAAEARLGDRTFDVDALAEAVFTSRSQLYRKLEALTGESPAALIRRLRLERAQQLLTGQVHSTITETAAAVGFSNVGYFSRLYREHFQQSPTDVLAGRTNVPTSNGTNVPDADAPNVPTSQKNDTEPL